MSCQPHRVTSGQSNSGHKQIHISKLFSHIYPSSVNKSDWTISRKMTRQSKRTRQNRTREEMVKGNQMTALRFQTGGRQTSLRGSLLPKHKNIHKDAIDDEYVSRFGLAVMLVSASTSVRFHFGSSLSSKFVVCGHCLVTLSVS